MFLHYQKLNSKTLEFSAYGTLQWLYQVWAIYVQNLVDDAIREYYGPSVFNFGLVLNGQNF